ncbi:penicillin-binding protein 1C [Massilia sp. PWRC2]|uniref:penicillin-binding protein 1C n=1 Tax=Massilia sp. PWRC2 TaxID=2804626 RepID=UPI003CE71959
MLVTLPLLALRLWPQPPPRQAAPVSSAIYARDGQLLRLALAADQQYRLWVPLAAIDARLPQAVLLYEDRWFYWHAGINPVALLRAATAYARGGGRRGASTISMQLARRLYDMNSQTPAGKLRQLAAALWLEARYSKHDLLEAYLNLAPYGGNIEGVAAASLIYFHKRAAHLTLAEVFTLAVIPQNPNQRGGAAGAGLQAARTRLAARWLAQHGDGAAPGTLAVALAPTKALPFLAPHLAERLLRERRSGEIWSGIDVRAQASLERIIGQFIDNRRAVGINNASALLLDRDSGEVRALVGSNGYFDAGIAGQVNGTEAKRSPGSTLKPFIYALALDQGLLHPATMLKDTPTTFGPFSPENFDGRFVGPISAQDALVRSRNVPAVALAARLQHPNLYDFLQRAGVSRLASEQHYGLALALGGGEVTMEELARLYLMLANGGVMLPVRHEGGSTAARANAPRLLSKEAAFITLQMLRTNQRPDTREAASPPVAWKTGTSWGFRDAWSAGVFGHYVLVVWIGNFDGVGNPAFIGIEAAAPLFFRIVDSLRAQGLDRPPPEAAAPAGVSRVEVCTASGELPNALCPQRSMTWFIPGTSSIRVSTLHRAVRVDASGTPTCARGPGTRTEVYEYWPTDLQRLFREAGMPRRQPPPPAQCDSREGDADDAPTIISPNRATVYSLRLSKPAPLTLRANAMGATDTLFWFANGGLIGKAAAGAALAWTPQVAGRTVLRVVDQHGRADSRDIDVEFVP